MRRTLLNITCLGVLSVLPPIAMAAQIKPAAAAQPSDMVAGRRIFDAQETDAVDIAQPLDQQLREGAFARPGRRLKF